MKKVALILLLCFPLLCAVPAFADQIIGLPADAQYGNCAPFGCAYSGEYQPWGFGDTLHIILSTPFTYSPGNGNLLMDVFVSGASDAGGDIFFDHNGYNSGGRNGNTIMGRVFLSGNIDSGYGLVTGFTTEETSPIPEPTSLLLLGTGLAGLALAAWRRKK